MSCDACRVPLEAGSCCPRRGYHESDCALLRDMGPGEAPYLEATA
jgi:hypothetical protein